MLHRPSLIGTPGGSAGVMSRVIQQHADLPRRHTRRTVVRNTAERTARWSVATFAGVGAGLLHGGAPALLAASAALLLAALFPLQWLATLPPRPGHPDPDAVRWPAGAAGERRTARLLRPMQRRGWAVLHDRLIPGSRANIDHLVIGPNGVQMIDSKAWSAPVRWWEGVLWCGGHPVDITTTAWEAMRVEEALRPAMLAAGCVRVEAVMCVHGPQLPKAGYTFFVSRAALGGTRDGELIVHVIAARNLRWHIQRCGAGVIGSADIGALSAIAALELPAAA